MTVFDKARELGSMILETEQAKERDKAHEEFMGNEDALSVMQEYEQFQHSIEARMRKGEMDDEQFKEASFKLKKLGAQVKAHPVAGKYVESVNNFNKMVNQVFQIIQGVALGELDNCCDGGNCGGGCCSGQQSDEKGSCCGGNCH